MCFLHSETVFIEAKFEEIVVPLVWEKQTFDNKISNETKNQMWSFTDKGNREVTLIPEVTGIIQEQYDLDWIKSKKKPIKLFYVSKCFRYEKPQAGRYREFTQFGIEILGDTSGQDKELAISLLKKCLDSLTIDYDFAIVPRALGYYTEDGFEASSNSLGAQKQIAGGGRYPQGIGWAIGVDRVMLLI